MKPSVRHLAWLLPLLLTACFHRTKNSQNQPFAPSIEELQPTAIPPLPSLPPPVVTLADQTPAPEVIPEQLPQTPPKPPVKRRKPPVASTQPNSSTAATPSENPGVSAIGQLSTGDSSDLRQQTIGSIAAIERGLNGISRSLSDQEKKTAAQIREFLKQARTALASGDVDGAHTLTVKAKVLLGELSQ
jgi:hypothetical protein